MFLNFYKIILYLLGEFYACWMKLNLWLFWCYSFLFVLVARSIDCDDSGTHESDPLQQVEQLHQGK